MKKSSELLLPVGNMQMCLAAIHNGADAVYIGMPYFNARGRTSDFGFDELKDMIDTCHLYGVKVHLAFNVLIFEPELPRVVELLKQAIELGPDAFIVQDLGLVKLIKEIAPEQIVHASTQMTISNFESIDLLEDLDIERFVLARECSLKEIEAIRKKTDKELEVFVHGALCVSYSGQCFTSEALGGRSANRGQCAQSCRFDYEMIVDGKKKNLVDKKYLVSPKDLCGLNEVASLQEIGVESFKVEGRLKAPEYVASTARNYKDVILNGPVEIKEKAQELSRTFSRGFFSGWLHGVDHQQLVEGTYGNHRGLELGEVVKVDKKKVSIKSEYIPHQGDGVLFVDDKNEIGSHIFQVEVKGKTITLGLDKKFLFEKINKGMRVFLNKDGALEKDLKKTFTDKNLLKKIPLRVVISGTLGKTLSLVATDGVNFAEVESESFLEQAQKISLDQEALKSAFGSLGHTCLEVKEYTFHLDEGLFLNQKELKKMKKEMVEQIYAQRTSLRVLLQNDYELPQPVISQSSENAKLNILLRSKEQLEDFVSFYNESDRKDYIGKVILDYEFGKDYGPSVELLHTNGMKAFIATTRILKPHEYHNLRQIIRCTPDGVLVRNLGALNFLKKEAPELDLFGDFSLNVTNSLTADYLKDKGLSSLCAGYDLNKSQLDGLIEHTPSEWLEITVHQYMPEFHMEHCVFAGFLSNGSSFKDCGKPCEKHQVELVDMYGNHHFLKADQECRNTMFLATPQAASTLMPGWMEKGVKNFRIEALFERGDELINKVDSYLKVLAGDSSAQEAFEKLNLSEKFGVSTGQLTVDDNYKSIKK